MKTGIPCEAGLTRCGNVPTERCGCCGLYLCSAHRHQGAAPEIHTQWHLKRAEDIRHENRETEEERRRQVYRHDCLDCEYLGPTSSWSSDNPEGKPQVYDLYYCGKGGSLGGSVIARYGDEPADYSSVPVKLLRTKEGRDFIPALHEAVRRYDQLYRGLEAKEDLMAISAGPKEAKQIPAILAFGNPFDGITMIGPFSNACAANDYADFAQLDDDWWVVQLDEPNPHWSDEED